VRGVPVSIEKRRAIFDRGAGAFASALPDALASAGVDVPLYVCPLCLRGFGVDALAGPDPFLTLEDVPPKAVGGRPMCLTCKPCNNLAGMINRAVVERERHREAEDPSSGRTIALRISDGDVEVGGQLAFQEGGVFIVTDPSTSNPTSYESLSDRIRTSSGTGPTDLTITVRTYSRRLARVSELRDAYLATFAWLGYRYILRSSLDVVRQQIRDPAAEVLSGWGWKSEALMADGRLIGIVTEPAVAVLVTQGQRGTLLPEPLGTGGDHWRWLERHGREEPAALTGRYRPWPIRMEKFMDLQKDGWARP
jgi:hypothetical protein